MGDILNAALEYPLVGEQERKATRLAIHCAASQHTFDMPEEL